MKDLSQKFRGSLPANTRKKESSHPDFTAKLTVWNTVYSAAAWFGTTKKGDRYISLHLTSDGDESQIEKIKLALWRNHDHQDSAGPHFRSTQSIYGHDFALKAWFVSSDDSYRLGVTIEPVDTDGAEVSDAALETRERIAGFLAEVGGPALPPAPTTAASLPAPPLDVDEEPADIPFYTLAMDEIVPFTFDGREVRTVTINGEPCYLPVSRGLAAIIDKAGFEFLSQWKWYAQQMRGRFYAIRNKSRRTSCPRGTISLHRTIIDAPIRLFR